MSEILKDIFKYFVGGKAAKKKAAKQKPNVREKAKKKPIVRKAAKKKPIVKKA
jgi:hypothetical protein